MKKALTIFAVTVFCHFSQASFMDLDGTSSHLKGPNCWNGAMYAAGVISHKRFMHPNEWNFYLENHCEKLEGPEKGAVGRLYLKDGGEVHGFIHLDDFTIFAKHGEDQAHGYKVMSYEEMLDQYGRTRSCRTSNRFDKECFHDLRYYRCASKANFSRPILRINEALENLSFSSETKLNYKDECTSDSFNARQEQLEIIKSALLEIRSSEYRDYAQENALKESYTHQLHNLQVSNRSFRCSDRKFKYKLIKEVRDLVKSTFTRD